MKPSLARSSSNSIGPILALPVLLTAACTSLFGAGRQDPAHDPAKQPGQSESPAKPEDAGYHPPEKLLGQQHIGMRQATVVTLTPVELAVGVSRGTNIEVEFNCAMDSQSVAGAITVRVGATVIAGTTTYDAALKKLTFDPVQDLPPNSAIAAHLSATTSQDGSTCSAYDWTFTTGG